MKYWVHVIGLVCVAVGCQVATGGIWDTADLVFRDDFDSGAAPEAPDPCDWVINHPGEGWHVMGRSLFPDPLTTDGPFPYLEDGVCIIEHHLFNPNHADPKDPRVFLGGEIHTVMAFEPDKWYRFEASVRTRDDVTYPLPGGLVSSFFTFETGGDEIDYEYLSNLIHDDANYPEGDPVVTNTWDDGDPCDEVIRVPGLSLTEWQTFRLYWRPGERVDWTWIDPCGVEVLVRSETDTDYIPDEAMAVYFNFWASDDGWPLAYDEALQPVDEEGLDAIARYEIDYVEVLAVPEPVTLAVFGIGAVAVLRRRRRCA